MLFPATDFESAVSANSSTVAYMVGRVDSNQPSCQAPDLQSGPLPATGYRPIFAVKGGLAQQRGLEPPTPLRGTRFPSEPTTIITLLHILAERVGVEPTRREMPVCLFSRQDSVATRNPHHMAE